MSAVVEAIQRDRPGCQRGAVKGNTGHQRFQCRVPQHGLAHPRKAPTLNQQPRIEARPGARVDPLQQLAASEPGIRVARSQRQHINRGPRRQPQLQRVVAERAPDAERATQLRQRPTQRPKRIIGIAEDQPGQPRPRDRSLRQDQIPEHGPRLVTTRRSDNHAIALDLRRSQQTDHERRHGTTIVTAMLF